jgi:hypothetical protein
MAKDVDMVPANAIECTALECTVCDRAHPCDRQHLSFVYK